MKLILLSGGSGTRLWPMSNDSRSKQFLKVLKDDQGRSVSMLQRVWSQLDKVGLQEDTFVCASRSQMEMIQSQLGGIPRVIVEPERRDTFAAVALSCLCLLDEMKVPSDEVVGVVPVDHLVDDHYFHTISDLERVLRGSGANLALMGVKPTEATSKFGYIRVIPDGMGNGWDTVDTFIEKPAVQTAKQLMDDGALWNCGIFGFQLGYLRDILTSKGLPTSYKQLLASFDRLPQRSFDYEVVEREKSIVVVPYDGRWADLGTWETLSDAMWDSFIGNGIASHCENTDVINELGIPVVAFGMKNTMVVSTPDGILVADKSHTSDLKQVVKNVAGRPMYEERRWGSYRVLDYQKLADQTEVLTKSIVLNAGRNMSYQRHHQRSEVWTLTEGTGEVVLDSKLTSIRAGDVVRIHPEQWHAIRAIDTLMFIEVQRGTELTEEDIERRYYSWDEILDYCNSQAF